MLTTLAPISISPAERFEALKKLQNEKVICYAPAYYDHSFKRILINSVDPESKKNEMGRDFCNAMLRLGLPGKNLSAREAIAVDEHVNPEQKNWFLLLKNWLNEEIKEALQSGNYAKGPQLLKTDATFQVDMDDKRRPPTSTRSRSGYQWNAYVLNEMQVRPQAFARRSIPYIAHLISGETIQESQNVFPRSVYAQSICMYESGDGSLVKALPTWNSNDIDPPSQTDGRFVEISNCNVFLGKPLRCQTEKTTVQEKRNALKKKVVEYFEAHRSRKELSLSQKYDLLNNKDKKKFASIVREFEKAINGSVRKGGIRGRIKAIEIARDKKNVVAKGAVLSFKKFFKKKDKRSMENLQLDEHLEERFADLSIEDKKVYFWLELIAFAHVMTEDDVQQSLSSLGDERKCLEQAYGILKLKLEGIADMEMIE